MQEIRERDSWKSLSLEGTIRTFQAETREKNSSTHGAYY